MAGGMIGYSIEESNDQACVRDYEARGFHRASTTTAPALAEALPPPTVALPPISTGYTGAAPITVSSGAGAIGEDARTVERLPDVLACNPQPRSVLQKKLPGAALYTVACSNGDVLSVRCEFGNCRILK